MPDVKKVPLLQIQAFLIWTEKVTGEHLLSLFSFFFCTPKSVYREQITRGSGE